MIVHCWVDLLNRRDHSVFQCFVGTNCFTGKNNGPSALFSDGEYIGQIAAAKDVRQFIYNFGI